MNEYEKQALDFLKKYGIKFNSEFIGNKFHFVGDKQKRDVYKVTFTRGEKEFSLEFGASIVDTMDGVEPNPYDVLACITKSDPGSFCDFCDEFGYNNDSISDLKVYKSVAKEWKKVNSFFSEKELEELWEIN